MKLDEKRMVVEVLLCGAKMGCMSAVYHLGYDRAVGAQGARRRAKVQRDLRSPLGFEQLAIEAAYRLIESSPTLRREWFAASREHPPPRR